MSGSTILAATMAAKPPSSPPLYGGVVVRKSPPGPSKKKQAPVSRDAQRVAAAILEVLAGVRTPREAAKVLSVTLARYYLWEQRALEGLVRACEPRPVGRAAGERHRVAVLEKEVVRLRQDCARHQALVRASQRTMGLAAAPPPATKPVAKPTGKVTAKAADTNVGKAKRKRRPVARAMKAVAALRAPAVEETAADSFLAPAVEVVQRNAPSNPLVAAEAAPAATAVSEA